MLDMFGLVGMALPNYRSGARVELNCFPFVFYKNTYMYEEPCFDALFLGTTHRFSAIFNGVSVLCPYPTEPSGSSAGE